MGGRCTPGEMAGFIIASKCLFFLYYATLLTSLLGIISNYLVYFLKAVYF